VSSSDWVYAKQFVRERNLRLSSGKSPFTVLYSVYCTLLSEQADKCKTVFLFASVPTFVPGGYLKMLSILADQQRPCIVYEPKCGGWGGPGTRKWV
jgi:hypothetical protein